LWAEQGVGAVVAQHAAAAGEDVLAEGAGLLVLAHLAQVDGEVVGGAEGVGMAVAHDALVSYPPIHSDDLPEGYHAARRGQILACWPPVTSRSRPGRVVGLRQIDGMALVVTRRRLAPLA
jgi:hypothetical protein